jgi:hypothetical protein
MTFNWFIDTWAPRDGIAFASFRGATPTDPEKNKDWIKGFERTVSLRPPNWEAIDVRPATSLRAERLTFQRGFFSSAQTEIEFETLEELVEVLRRAYVASGGDADGGPGPVDGEPRQPSPLDENENDLSSQLDMLRKEANVSRASGERTAFRFVQHGKGEACAAHLISASHGKLDQALLFVAKETTLLFAARVAEPRNERFLPTFYEWLNLMLRGGLIDPYELANSTTWTELRDWLEPIYYYGRRSWPYAWCQSYSQVSGRPSFVLHHAPMPALNFRRSDQERLIDRLLFALASPSVLGGLTRSDELASLLLPACTINAQQDGPWAWRQHPAQRRDGLTRRSLAWLLGELPAPLGNIQAGNALDQFAFKETTS